MFIFLFRRLLQDNKRVISIKSNTYIERRLSVGKVVQVKKDAMICLVTVTLVCGNASEPMHVMQTPDLGRTCSYGGW